jgi:hypothetical protein
MLNNNLQAINPITVKPYGAANSVQKFNSAKSSSPISFKGSSFEPRKTYIKIDDRVIIPEELAPPKKTVTQKIADGYHSFIKFIARHLVKAMETEDLPNNPYGYRINYYV